MMDAAWTYRRFFRLIEGSFGALFGMIAAKVILDGLKGLRA